MLKTQHKLDGWQLSRSWKKHLILSAVTCLSSDRTGVNMALRTWTASYVTTGTPSRVRERQQTWIFNMLYSVPVHISSVLSMLSLSWLAEPSTVQWPTHNAQHCWPM